MSIRIRTLVLLLGLCASVTALGAPASAGASGGCAPRLSKLMRFDGRAAMEFQASASGEVPGTTKTETVALSRYVDNVRFHLKRVVGRKGTNRGKYLDFLGVPSRTR